VIVVVSDGDHRNDEDPYDELLVLKSHNVKVFTVGIGAWLRKSIMRGMATKPSYFGDNKEWLNLLETQLAHLTPGKWA